MCASSGPRADPHPVPVRGAGVLRHGLPGAEEVHPPGPGSQVVSITRCIRALLLGERSCSLALLLHPLLPEISRLFWRNVALRAE